MCMCGGLGGCQDPQWLQHSVSLFFPQACTLLLMVLFFYDVFFVFITPFITKVGPPLTPPTPAWLPQPCPDTSPSPLIRAVTASW